MESAGLFSAVSVHTTSFSQHFSNIKCLVIRIVNQTVVICWAVFGLDWNLAVEWALKMKNQSSLVQL